LLRDARGDLWCDLIWRVGFRFNLTGWLLDAFSFSILSPPFERGSVIAIAMALPVDEGWVLSFRPQDLLSSFSLSFILLPAHLLASAFCFRYRISRS